MGLAVEFVATIGDGVGKQGANGRERIVAVKDLTSIKQRAIGHVAAPSGHLEVNALGRVVTAHVIAIESQADHLGIGGKGCGTHIHVALGKVLGGNEVFRLELEHAALIAGGAHVIVLDILIHIHIHRQRKQQGVARRLLHIGSGHLDCGICQAKAGNYHSNN